MSDFTPKFRMIVMSDIHVKENKDCIELSRLRRGLDFAYNVPDTITAEIKDISPGKYTVEVIARGFWRTVSANSLKIKIKV